MESITVSVADCYINITNQSLIHMLNGLINIWIEVEMKIIYKILIALIVIAIGFGLSLATYHLFGYDKIMSFWQYILLRSK
ncbi:hypothetical protein EFK39_10660 [Lactococcus lactis subsp. lactis]|nr:hypothetical protein [Lactococcus lactis subsp. lactis]